jgi:hypothetical protein
VERIAPAETLPSLVADIAAVERLAAAAYDRCLAEAPTSKLRDELAHLSEELRTQTDLLSAYAGREVSATPPLPQVSPWASELVLAYSLHQAALGTLAALAEAHDPELAALARRTLERASADEAAPLAGLRTAVAEAPGSGPRLAADMTRARDWIRAFFPRKARLVELVAAGQLAPSAPVQHDRHLAAVGDRLQEVLGVQGDL